MPPNTIYVGRPSAFGNPFKLAEENNERKFIIEEYKKIIIPIRNFVKKELKGKNLACWCALNQPCHADILLSIANE